MSWKLPSTRYLEDLIRRNEAIHTEAVAALKDQHEKLLQATKDGYEARIVLLTSTIEELKKANAEDKLRGIEENKRLKEDNEKMRVLLTPAIQAVELEPDKTPPPEVKPGKPRNFAELYSQTVNEITAEQEKSSMRYIKTVAAEGPQGEN